MLQSAHALSGSPVIAWYSAKQATCEMAHLVSVLLDLAFDLVFEEGTLPPILMSDLSEPKAVELNALPKHCTGVQRTQDLLLDMLYKGWLLACHFKRSLQLKMLVDCWWYLTSQDIVRTHIWSLVIVAIWCWSWQRNTSAFSKSYSQLAWWHLVVLEACKYLFRCTQAAQQQSRHLWAQCKWYTCHLCLLWGDPSATAILSAFPIVSADRADWSAGHSVSSYTKLLRTIIGRPCEILLGRQVCWGGKRQRVDSRGNKLLRQRLRRQWGNAAVPQLSSFPLPAPAWVGIPAKASGAALVECCRQEYSFGCEPVETELV